MKAETMERVKRQYAGFEIDYMKINCEEFLPSKGVYYGDDKFVYMRGLKYKEQLAVSKLYELPNSAETLRKIIQIYKNAIVMDNIMIEDIIYDDFINLMMWVALLTNESSTIAFNFSCTACGKENNSDILLAESSEFGYRDHSILGETKLETSLGEIVVKPITIGAFLELLESPEDIDEFKDCIYIHSHNGDEIPLNRKASLLGMLELTEVTKFYTLVKGYKSAINPIKRKCFKCEAENQVHLQMDFTKGLP